MQTDGHGGWAVIAAALAGPRTSTTIGAPVSRPLEPVELTVVDTHTAEWQGFAVDYIGATLPHIPLVDDPDTGMMVAKMTYPAGHTTPWHTHPCAHGVYILAGTLDTHQGRYAPGTFVWFPEGGLMEHGATQDEDVTFLFITNKKFAIHFVGDENDPDAPVAAT